MFSYFLFLLLSLGICEEKGVKKKSIFFPTNGKSKKVTEQKRKEKLNSCIKSY